MPAHLKDVFHQALSQASTCNASSKPLISKVWQPNLYIVKLGKMKVKKIFGNPSLILAVKDMEETSQVAYYSEAAVTFSWSMGFATFPCDEQLCTFKLANYDLLTIEEFVMTNLIADFGKVFEAFSPTDKDYEYQVLLPSFNFYTR